MKDFFSLEFFARDLGGVNQPLFEEEDTCITRHFLSELLSLLMTQYILYTETIKQETYNKPQTCVYCVPPLCL